ncbi:MAG TPA: HDOD domain-containing protein [Steroidobacteraceae bacterium]|jgi:HD-like signal output (HDOD) protein
MTNAGTPPAAMTPQERTAALAFLKNLATEVSQGTIDLPCFPDVVVRISHALADPNTTSDRIVTVVGAEPRLAARILQTANSAAFNSSGKPLTDLRAAITRLGQQMVQGTAMSYAMQHMKNEASMRSIAKPLAELWSRSIAVASISKLVAGRTKVNADEAFLTGLLHGIGSLYIMARAATFADGLQNDHPWLDLIGGWQASIGKAVLQSWGFADEICDAIGDQSDFDRKWKHQPTHADILIASLVLADALRMPERRTLGTDGINAFLSIGVTPADCDGILKQAEAQIRLVHEALG